jgi:hypothetical protein
MDQTDVVIQLLLTFHDQTQREIMDGLEDRVELVSKDVQMLPALSHEATRAITDGKQTIVSAASEGIDQYRGAAADFSVSNLGCTLSQYMFTKIR